MPNASDFTNQARNRLLGVLGVSNKAVSNGRTPAMSVASPAGGGGGAFRAGGGNGNGNNDKKTPGAVGRTCASDRDCGQNTRCVNGSCVARGQAGGDGGTKPPPAGDGTCNPPCNGPDRVCKQGKCVKVNTGGGGGGGGCNGSCKNTEKCVNGVCVPKGTQDPCGGKCKDGESCENGQCVADTGSKPCDASNPCPGGQTCSGGVCVSPTPDQQLEDTIAADPSVYMTNLAMRGGLNTRGGTSFGNFITNRFNDITGEYEARGITNANLGFRDWLRQQNRYGNPYLAMEDMQLGVPGNETVEPATRNGNGNNGSCATDAECGAGKPYCVNGVCQAEPAQMTTPVYQNVTPFGNYLRSQYYGASARDRGISPEEYGGSSTRWSAW